MAVGEQGGHAGTWGGDWRRKGEGGKKQFELPRNECEDGTQCAYSVGADDKPLSWTNDE